MALQNMDDLMEDAFELSTPEARKNDGIHIYGNFGAVCATDTRGHEFPRGLSRYELVLDSTEGFIPLWDRDVTLRWRFNKDSLERFTQPVNAATGLRLLMGRAVEQWGDAVPIRFVERNDAFDFEVSVRDTDRCSMSGCVMASAFFPDPGRHELTIYPSFFNLPTEEQVETLAHEFGHIFGLRHFFALLDEKKWPAQIYGEHNPFTIMNYGKESKMTDTDRDDLRNLYLAVWSGKLTRINGTPIRLMRPFHEQRSNPTVLDTLSLA